MFDNIAPILSSVIDRASGTDNLHRKSLKNPFVYLVYTVQKDLNILYIIQSNIKPSMEIKEI